jgi:hypothetical protein
MEGAKMNPSISGMRKARFLAVTCIMLCCINFSMPGLVYAQDLDIDSPSLAWPDPSYDYGNVAIGESKTVTFDLSSEGPSPVWVYVVGLNETPDDITIISPGNYLDPQYVLGAFSFDPTDDIWAGFPFYGIPQETPVGAHIPIDILFTPTSMGDFSAYLYIASNDSVDEPGTQAFIHLLGTGVEGPAIPEPASIILVGLGLIGLIGFKRRLR